MRFDKPLRAEKFVRHIPQKILGFIPWTKTISDWKVLEDFRFYFDDDRPAAYVLVPAGFITDLASVPGFLGFIVQKDGDFAQAAVTHDFCYRHRGDVVWLDMPLNLPPQKGQPLTRSQQDGVFMHGMGVLGTALPIRFIMWRAVRRFGWISYPTPEEEAEKNAQEAAGNPPY